MVGYGVFGTKSFDDGLQMYKMAMVDSRKQMVFDLVVETPEEKIAQVVGNEGMGCNHLMGEIIVVFGHSILRGEMIDLGGEHKTEGMQEHRHRTPYRRLVGIKYKPRPCPQ